jgi:hypothetical protein
MPASSQDIIAFKAKYPAFARFADADIATAFSQVDVFTDPSCWDPTVYAAARQLWVANQLMVMNMIGTAPIGGTSALGALSSFMTPLGDLFMREIRFGERTVSFDQRRLFEQIASGASVADAALSLTYFGLQYQTLRNRTFPAVAIV